MPKKVEHDSFFKNRRGQTLDTLLEGRRGDAIAANGAVPADSRSVGPTTPNTTATTDGDRRPREATMPGILKKSPSQLTNGKVAAVGKERSIDRPPDGRGRPRRTAAAAAPAANGGKPARSLVGSESGLTNYEDDNTSLGGWRWLRLF